MVTAEKQGISTRVEYRIERMPFQEHPEAHLSELLARLNELGSQGWHIVAADMTHHPSYSPAAQPSVALPVLLVKPVGVVRRVEFRIERMPFQEHPEAHLSELLERITGLGKEGWRAVSVDLTHHPSYSPAAQPTIAVPVLLEREL